MQASYKDEDLDDLMADLDTPSPASTSPHQKLLDRKLQQGIISSEEYEILKNSRRKWKAASSPKTRKKTYDDKLKDWKASQPRSREENIAQVKQWQKDFKRERSNQTKKLFQGLDRRVKKIEEEAPLKRVIKGLDALKAKGTRKTSRGGTRTRKSNRKSNRKRKRKRTRHRRH